MYESVLEMLKSLQIEVDSNEVRASDTIDLIPNPLEPHLNLYRTSIV